MRRRDTDWPAVFITLYFALWVVAIFTGMVLDNERHARQRQVECCVEDR